MWIFTVNGFFTVIQDRKDPAFVWLRSRLREDIERNFPGVEVTEHPGADYLFRAKLPREQVAQRLFELAMENNVTSHFKDVMIRTASKPEFGSRSSMLYGVWTAGAAMQPIAPYSKQPRVKQAWTPPKTGSTPGGGRYGSVGTSFSSRPATSSRGGARASDFDWDAQAWGGGDSQRDPDQPPVQLTSWSEGQLTKFTELDLLGEGDFEAVWLTLTDADRESYLDYQEELLDAREALGGGDGDFLSTPPQMADVYPAPRNRPGNRKERRKAKRKNRHNQDGLSSREVAARDRQTFLDREARKNGKG